MPFISSPSSSAASSVWTTLTKVADQSVTNSTTAVNDDTMFFTAVSGAFYVWEAYVWYASPAGAGTPDLKTFWSEDGTDRGTYFGVGVNTTDTAQLAQLNDQNIVSQQWGTAATNRGIRFSGNHWGNGGVFRLTWAQNTANANPTIVRAGSQLLYQRVV